MRGEIELEGSREKVQETEKDREGDRQERQFPIKRIVIPGMSSEAGNRRE